MYHNFLIHTDRHLGYFHVLAIVNSAAMNIGIHVFFNSGFLGVYAQQQDFWVVWQFYFQVLRNLHSILHSGHTSWHIQKQCKRLLFSPQPL